jgi:hypothetical protein
MLGIGKLGCNFGVLFLLLIEFLAEIDFQLFVIGFFEFEGKLQIGFQLTDFQELEFRFFVAFFDLED